MTSEVISRSKPIQTPNFKNNHKWKNLSKLNHIFLLEKRYHYIHREILDILNLLPFSHEIKKKIYEYMMKKKFKCLNEVWENFYKLICINDLPISTRNFLKIFQNGRKYKFKIFTKLQTESVRKYYWYITKQTEKAKKMLGFSNEENQRIYKIVFDYYNLIRFKMLKSANPVYLIQNLVYYTVREKLRPNQQKFGKKSFELKDFSYVNRLVRYLKEIKDLNLDAHFTEKLEISKRNERLLAKI